MYSPGSGSGTWNQTDWAACVMGEAKFTTIHVALRHLIKYS